MEVLSLLHKMQLDFWLTSHSLDNSKKSSPLGAAYPPYALVLVKWGDWPFGLCLHDSNIETLCTRQVRFLTASASAPAARLLP